MVWVNTKVKRPPTGALIVKRWRNGAVWAGRYFGTEKDSSFDEWCLIE